MRKILAVLIGSLFITPTWAAVTAASVVSIQGKAEVRPVGTFEWKSVKTRQDLESGDFVRTGNSSQMAVLFSNKTQIRLSQNSQMQIKSLGEPATEQAAILLSAGRAWSQIKPQTSGRTGYARVSMETPSATMSIRGTDWEVEVDPDGRTQLVVLSGTVDIGNEQGSIQVGKNEAAVAEVGKAPVKIVLTNPQARVQWVTAYRPEPWRYLLAAGGPAVAPVAAALRSGNLAGAEAEAAKLGSGTDSLRARAAVMVAQGKFAETRALLEPAPADWMRSLILADLRVLGGQPDAALEMSKSAVAAAPDAAAAGVARAHMARLLLIGDRESEIPALLEPSLKPDGSVDAWVAEGTRARFAGEAPRAQTAFGEAARIGPQDERGWLGLGAVASEKEDAKPARELLNKAATLNPNEPASFAELGTLESFANRFDAAGTAFDKALALQPDDYVALTGQGIMKLKQGKTEEALDDFLRAGVLEPRYARARLYTGITYYQMGNIGRALEEFDKAAELDPKDPLPHLYASMVATDTFDAATAVARARDALERMPNLKSLNQVANNQKGVANVANALAFTGLKDWAMAYAQDGYYPFWAGSHLFLADFYQGQFAKQSELFQGFVSDPTIFGASNRFQTLVSKPGHYQTLTAVAARDSSINSVVPRLTLSGYDNAYSPFAYFLDIDQQVDQDREHQPFDYNRRKETGTVALGWQPTNELRLFGFYTSGRQTNTFRTTDGSDSNDRISLHTSDLSLGLSYRFSPTFMLQMRAASSSVDASLVNDAPFAPGFREFRDFNDALTAHDGEIGIVYRHEDRYEIAAGYEAGRSPESGGLRSLIQPGSIFRFFLPGIIAERTNLGYVSGKLLFGGADYVQADLWATDYDRRITGDPRIGNRTIPFGEVVDTHDKVTARFGFTFQPWSHQRLRYAFQDWIRPSMTGTLGPVATAGVPLDDTLLRFGGRQRRNVLRLESEWSSKLFTEVSYDRQRVSNPETINSGISPLFANISRLRQGGLGDVTNFYAASTASSSELSTASNASSIRFDKLRLAANAILNDQLSGSVAYAYTDSRLVLTGFPSDRFYLPRNTVDFGLTWVSPQRYRLSFDARWRSRSWSLVDLVAPRDSYWTGAFSTYWETADKRAGLSFFAQDMFSKYHSTYYGLAGSLKF